MTSLGFIWVHLDSLGFTWVYFGSLGFTCLLDLVSMVDVKDLIYENEGPLLGGVLEESSSIFTRYRDPIGSIKKTIQFDCHSTALLPRVR